MRIITGLAAIAVALSLAPANAQEVAKGALAQPLVLQGEGSFFIGGREVRSDSISFSSTFGTSGVITVDQIYVQPQWRRRHVATALLVFSADAVFNIVFSNGLLPVQIDTGQSCAFRIRRSRADAIRNCSA